MLYFIRTEEDISLESEAPHSKARWMAQIDLHEPIAGSKILTHVDFTAAQTVPAQPQHKFEYNIHLLKSNLQKSFRRQLWQPCLATLLQMIYQDPAETLRRLPVILLEDSMLYPHLYNKVIWLQFATSRGYRLGAQDIQIIIDALATGLESASRYNLSLVLPTAATATVPEKTSFWQRPPAAREAYIGPRLRSLAGGMKFDTKFLHVLALRALTADLPLETEYSSVDLADIEEFAPSKHMIPQAIDFHCCPQILKDLPHKETIWWHWSSLNTRPINDRDGAVEEGREKAHRIQHEKTYENIERALQVNAHHQIDMMAANRKKPQKNITLDNWLAKAKAVS
jgi:hypothetical protein